MGSTMFTSCGRASSVTSMKIVALCRWLTMISSWVRLVSSKATAVSAAVASTVGPRS